MYSLLCFDNSHCFSGSDNENAVVLTTQAMQMLIAGNNEISPRGDSSSDDFIIVGIVGHCAGNGSRLHDTDEAPVIAQ